MSEIQAGVTTAKVVSDLAPDTGQEVATNSQENNAQPAPEVGDLIAESKKYRTRAQSAEDSLDKLEKKLATDRENQMAEQNKWQELAEERGSKLKNQEPVIEAAMAELKTFREELLADFSEEDKEAFGDLNISQLKLLHGKLNQESKAVAPTDGTPARTVNPDNKNWTDLPDEERRGNWQSILDSYRKK